MTQINKKHLIFLQEAKEGFETNPKWKTYRDDYDTYIALRTGADDDCIEIYELGDRVASFVQQLEVKEPSIVGTTLNEGVITETETDFYGVKTHIVESKKSDLIAGDSVVLLKNNPKGI